MNVVQTEDCQNIGNFDFIDWQRFCGITMLVTGATGLIGSNLVNALAYNSEKKGLGIKLILPVRDVDAATRQFGWTGAELFPYTLGTALPIHDKVDYIVHLASPTSSKYFAEQPVETMLANFEGTWALLEWAREHPVKKFVSLSTMEVYGCPEKGHKVKESELGAFETMNARNSYPIAKLACETLCHGFYKQYGVPAVILRATQTFGPGVKYDDGRVFAQFMRCAVEKKDIVLKSAGLTERSYLYTADCVSAILVALLRGVPGEAYTIANPETYCSIKEMAEIVAGDIAREPIEVVLDLADDISKFGYASTIYMDLDISKMEKLGWKPAIGIREMYRRMIDSLDE